VIETATGKPLKERSPASEVEEEEKRKEVFIYLI
jgi:hypothetical protein